MMKFILQLTILPSYTSIAELTSAPQVLHKVALEIDIIETLNAYDILEGVLRESLSAKPPQ